MFGLDNLIEMLFESAMESISRNERIIKLLKQLNLDPDHPPEDFMGVYQYALVQYGVGKPRPVLEIFRQPEIQQLFREALAKNNPALLLKQGEAFLSEHSLQTELQANHIDVRREFYEFAAVFIEVAKRTRTPAEILTNQKLESLHRQISGLQERLNRLPTLEGMRTEMARLAAQDYPALTGAESFSAERCRAFALAQQMRGWFETLGYRFETHEVWEADYFEWVINVSVWRSRYIRILVRGVDGEVGLADVYALRQSVETQKTDEGWLVSDRRIARAARDQVSQPENDHLGCYTLDELLDQDADFSGYLTWLEQEIQQRGIDQKYVPLACVKEEVDPVTRQRIGVSRYDEQDGWIDGYLDLWLDDPAKEHISILGEFGTGKTWFAFHYAWKALQRYRDAQRRGLERPRLPLVIPLRDYAKAVSVESLFSEFFFRKHEIPIPGYSAFEQLNRMGKLLLIFDGFDEMAARVDRQQMINNFWELAKVVVPGAKVILTCRTEHFPEAKEGRALLNAELQASTKDLTGETPQFEVLELEKFNDEQIRQVLSYQAQPTTVEQIVGNPQLLDLARRPVLTELILEALPDIEAGKPVDMSRVYLYAVRHKMERDIKAERTFTSMADKLYFLCELSWEMLSTDRMSINYREFPDRIRKLFGSAVEEEKDLDHWHYDMMGQTMLIRNATGDYTPAHRSLLEFFTAYKFVAELKLMAPDFAEIGDPSVFESKVTLPSTFGKFPLSKAIMDLILPMLKSDKSTMDKLFNLVFETRGNTESEAGYLGGNATKLLLSIEPNCLENKDLSRSLILGVNFANANLRDTNLSNSNLTDSTFLEAFTLALSIAFSPDDQFLATGEANGKVRLWKVSDGKQLYALRGHTDWIRSVKFSPSGKFLVSSGADRVIKIWNIESRECVKSLHGHNDTVRSLSINSTETLLASASFDQTIRLWDFQTGECLHVLEGHTGRVWKITFSPDGILASGCGYPSNMIKLWDVEKGDCFQTFVGHLSNVYSLVFSKDARILVSGSADKTIRFWSLDSGECIRKIERAHESSIGLLILNQNNSCLISGGSNGLIKLWDMNSGNCLQVLREHSQRIRSLALSSNDEILASSSSDRTVKFWNFKERKSVRTLQGHSNWINSITVSSNSQILASGDNSSKVKIWDIHSGKCIKSFTGHKDWINSVSISPNNKTLASCSGDRTARLWDVFTGKALNVLKGHTSRINEVVFSADGLNLATSSGDRTIKLWSTNSGECIITFQGHEGSVNSVSICSNNNILISGSEDHTIKIWDIRNGRCIKTLEHSDKVYSIATSAKCELFASGSDDCTVKLWSIKTGECLKIFKGHSSRIGTVAFDSNQKLLVTGSLDQTIRLWDIKSGRCCKVFQGHTNRIQSVTLMPDGRTLISGSYDETIRLWDIESGNCVKVLINKPYAGMKIKGIRGITEAEKTTLKALGAVED